MADHLVKEKIRVRFYRGWPRFAALAALASNYLPRLAALRRVRLYRVWPRFAAFRLNRLAANYRLAALRL